MSRRIEFFLPFPEICPNWAVVIETNAHGHINCCTCFNLIDRCCKRGIKHGIPFFANNELAGDFRSIIRTTLYSSSFLRSPTATKKRTFLPVANVPWNRICSTWETELSMWLENNRNRTDIDRLCSYPVKFAQQGHFLELYTQSLLLPMLSPVLSLRVWTITSSRIRKRVNDKRTFHFLNQDINRLESAKKVSIWRQLQLQRKKKLHIEHEFLLMRDSLTPFCFTSKI